jgi:DNA-binding GntR family transcriptional regulator
MLTDGGIPKFGSSSVRTAHRDVTERLRQAIVSGVLPAGMRLVQAELATDLNVSITPVREALRELEGQGLVDLDPFRGATVHEVSLAELNEIYALRRALLPLAVNERISTITDDELRRAEEIVARMTAQTASARWVEESQALHRLLDGTSTQTHLRTMLCRLSDVSSLYVGMSLDPGPSHMRRSRADHKALIKAYRRRNAEEVIAISLRHLDDTLAATAKALLGKANAPDEARV